VFEFVMNSLLQPSLEGNGIVTYHFAVYDLWFWVAFVAYQMSCNDGMTGSDIVFAIT
jgi:hypothetical protein